MTPSPASKNIILRNVGVEGAKFTYALRFRFKATNNEAKYKALIAGLRIAEEIGVRNLQANMDSRLVANQVNGTYTAKEADMTRYLEKVRALASGFRMFSIKQVPRSENKKADALSKIASTSFAHLSKQVLVEELKEKSINKVEVLAVVEEEGNTWITPIYEYLTEGTLPAEANKARVVQRKSQRFAVIKESCTKSHFLDHGYGTRSVVAKALRTRYYWPTMHKDARALIRACQDCQVHRPIQRNPQQKLTPITSLWPFYKWGIDIAGPFPEGPANGLVERANRSLGDGIKARLDASNKNWMEEISHVLWAHRTMIKSSNEDTPFSLTYGTKAVILAEIGMPTLRTAEVDMVQNDEALEINLDHLEERREQAAIRDPKSKAKMEKYYNSKVRSTSFKPGDLVYHSNDASHTEEVGKLGPKREGPYEVTEALGKGAYKLRDYDGKQLSRTWNVRNLKKCYVHEM
ncbi:reverse transcriptase domain-containing protein [Tanacetum coccineum]|uniref:Reverse transcriptase domain-containing protein n=1 Tax=Tanacetum coccineum TaxID=301880 RepID=A0ABQ5AR24_9ASTR